MGAGGHAALASLSFCLAHPAPQCTPMVLQLSQALGRLRRGSVLKFVHLIEGWRGSNHQHALQDKQAPFHNFKLAAQACGL